MGSPDTIRDSSAGLRYADRREAGRELASHLEHYRDRPEVVVLGLPRGGVPVAFEVAEAIGAPLDVFVVRKLGLPGRPEFAIGAIASGGVRVLSDDVIDWYRIPENVIDALSERELVELKRREIEYRGERPLMDLHERVVILVDDGLATGSSMRAAVQAVRAHHPARVIVAVPVGAPETCRQFADIADETVCARTPEPFSAVGLWYRDFSQTTDKEVRELLERRAARAGGATRSSQTG